MKVKVLSDSVTYRGGSSVKDDVVEIPTRSAEYLIANGYVEAYVAEVGKVPIGASPAKTFGKGKGKGKGK